MYGINPSVLCIRTAQSDSAGAMLCSVLSGLCGQLQTLFDQLTYYS